MAERILGLVGGLGPESTLDYYRRIVDGFTARRPGEHPRLLVNSLNGGALFPDILGGHVERIADVVRPAVAQLAAGGAGLGMICSVATHQAFELVADGSPIPLVSIIEATARAAQAAGAKRPAVFAPRITAEGEFFSRPFERAGIELVRPGPADLAWISEMYVNELVAGVFRPESRERLLGIFARLQRERDADALILAGTELSLILPEPAYGGAPVLNAAAIHVEAALDWLLAGEEA
jgi:aspartate racemase